jgi:hypothetical protein
MTTRSKITMAMLITAVLSGAMASAAEARRLPPHIPDARVAAPLAETCGTICTPPPPRCRKPGPCLPR